MNSKLLLFIAFLLCFANQFLRAEPTDSTAIKGILIDKETGSPIQFVIVSIFKNNSTIPLKSFSTKEDGSFAFENITSGAYRIQADLIGFTPYIQKINITTGHGLNLGKISLNANSKNLTAVEVTGTRSAMKLGIDRKIFTVDQSISSAGASASDLLKNIPSVQVDEEGTVSLRNSTAVTVWIDGKPSGLTSDNQGQVLEEMPAESIEKIEVITNPSAKYSPEGSAGIINIVLKKDRKAGHFGSVRIGGSYPKGYELGGNINYSSSKIDLYGNIGMRNNSNEGTGYTDRQTYTTDASTSLIDTSYLNSNTKRTTEMDGLFFRGGIDYHITNKQTLSLSTFIMDGSFQTSSDISYDYLNNASFLTQQNLRNTNSKNDHNNYNLTLDYNWEIGENHSLQSSFSYGKRSNTSNDTYKQTNSGEVTGTSYQEQSSPSNSQNGEFQLDYTNKISDLMKIETGLKSDWSETQSEDQIYNGISSGDDWEISDPNVSNNFNYHEWINAIYGTLSGKISSDFGYQLGLRGEKTNISFTTADLLSSSNANTEKFSPNYFDLFPSFFLTYNFSKESELQFNYSRRINRPRGRFLNPFENITDSTNIFIGNPALNPEYANSYEMNFMQTWDNHTLSSTLYHRATSGVIQTVSYLDNGVMYQSPSNATDATSSGFELVAKDQFTKIIETTSTVDFYYETMKGFTYRDIYYNGTNGLSWNARINATFSLPKGLSSEISGFYTAPHLAAQGKTLGNYTLDLGLRKTFLDRKLQVSINARNLLNSFKFENTTTGDSFYQKTSNQFFGRNFRLNLTWNFGNQKPHKVKAQKEDNNENENSMDLNNEL